MGRDSAATWDGYPDRSSHRELEIDFGAGIVTEAAGRLAGRPGKGSSTQQVEMKVEDSLPRLRAIVNDNSIAGSEVFIACDLLNHQEQMSQDCRVCLGTLIQGFQVLSGDDQNMGRSLGVDVAEGHGMLIFLYDLSRYPVADDATKNAVRHALQPFS